MISGAVAGGLAAICCSIIAFFVYTTLRYRSCWKTDGIILLDLCTIMTIITGEQPMTDLACSPNAGSSIYEEIPGNNLFKSRHAHEREEGYVSITTSGRITRDILPSEQPTSCEMVRVCSTILLHMDNGHAGKMFLGYSGQ